MTFRILFISVFFLQHFISCAQKKPLGHSVSGQSKIVPAAERLDLYLPMLINKRVAIFANNTSMVGSTHLVDTLLKKGVQIKKIFAPEHGFRGTADAGERVGNTKDPGTGIDIISLYGKKRKPSKADLEDVDLIVFDIQDVGARFFTYISSLEELSESAVEFGKPLIVLDRPNPNGFYVDGPVLKTAYRSFVGSQQIPVVYGMTIGEYISMYFGEKWMDSTIQNKKPSAGTSFSLKIIPCDGYTHKSRYLLPFKPSPNLPDMASVYLYPSTCFFEGTALSEGRGTDRPFQVFGHPSLPDSLYTFTVRSLPGAKSPKLLDSTCHGWDLGGPVDSVLAKVDGRIQLKWLITAYDLFPRKGSFFINKGANFNRLAGTEELKAQIISGDSEESIRGSWQPALKKFKDIRKKYLLYPDFE